MVTESFSILRRRIILYTCNNYAAVEDLFSGVLTLSLQKYVVTFNFNCGEIESHERERYKNALWFSCCTR